MRWRRQRTIARPRCALPPHTTAAPLSGSGATPHETAAEEAFAPQAEREEREREKEQRNAQSQLLMAEAKTMAAMKASARQQATLAASQAVAEAALVDAQNEAMAVADAEAAERRKERSALLRLNKSLTRHNSSLQSQLAGSSALVSECVPSTWPLSDAPRSLDVAHSRARSGCGGAGGTLWRRR